MGVVRVEGLPASFVERRFGSGDDMLGFQMAFDVTGDPEFPEKAAFEVARELGVPVTTHAGVWGATNDDGIKLMHDHGFMEPGHIYVHAATLTEDSYNRIAATGGSVSVSTESEQSAGQGYPPTWQLRKHDIPVSLSMDTSVWWSGDLFCAMRSTLGADRSREHLEAHAKAETVTNHHLRAEQVVDWATRGGSKALGMDDKLGSLEEGKKADVVLVKNEHSPVMFPVLHPYGHVAFQAQRGDVHTVIVNGRVVKRDGRLVDVDLAAARRAIDETVEFAQREIGDRWVEGMHPEIPETRILAQPVPVHAMSERLDAIVADAVAALHGVLEKHQVTEREWHAALRFLTDIGRADEFVLLSDVTRTSVLVDGMSHTDDDGATASDVEGPLYVDDPPWREKPVRVYEEYEGMGDADVLFVRGSVSVGRRDAAARGGHRHLADGAFRRLRHLGRAPARVQLPRALEGRGVGRRLRVPDDAAEAVHGADQGAGGPVSGGGRPAPVAAGAHPLQGRRAGPRAAGHAGVLPGRPVPGERHHRRGQAGSGSAGRARGRPPGLPVRHRPAAGGVSRFASCSSGERRFAALVEGDVGAAAGGHLGARRRYADRGPGRPCR